MTIAVDLAQMIPAAARSAAAERAFRAAVDAERDRRLARGIAVTLPGHGPVRLRGRERDQIALLALKDTARDMAAAGVTAAVIPFRDAEDAEHLLSPAQICALADAGKGAAARIYRAAWAIKAAQPRPAELSDEALWT